MVSVQPCRLMDRFLAFVASLLVGLLLGLPIGEAASTTLSGLIEGAKKETVLTTSWSENDFGGAEGLAEIVTAMNKKYGLTLKPRFIPGPSMPVMAQKIVQEARGGIAASTDVLIGTAGHHAIATREGALQVLEWQRIIQRPWPSDVKMARIGPGGASVLIGSRIAGITHNTNIVKGDDVPISMEDVLKPKWKGRIASTASAATLTNLAEPAILGEKYMTDYVQRLSRHIGGLIRCDAVDRITTGEFVMLAFDCGGNDVMHLRETVGAPINSVSVREAARLNLTYLAVPRTSRSPNAAALFIDFIHSPEGQRLYWKHDRIDLHVYPESNTHGPVKKLLESGTKVSVGTMENYLEHFEYLERIGKEFRRILAR